MLAHAFDVLGATRVTLKTDALNARSRAAILKLGARFEGVLRKHSRRHDAPGLRDTAIYSILADEWPEVRAGLEARLASVSSTGRRSAGRQRTRRTPGRRP